MTNKSTSTIWDMLDFVEKFTGRKFIVADKTAAPHHQQFWYDRYIAEYRCTKYFSNRPFPKANKPVRQKQFLPAMENFLRVDAELPDHTQCPSQETRDGFIEWAKKEGAIGSLQTPHGSHAYFLFDTAFPWSKAKQVVEKLMSSYTGEYVACDASWCTSDWSRSNTNKDCNLDFYTAAATTTQHTFLYCETISTSFSTIKADKPVAQNYTKKARTSGSRQENAEEFKRVWWDVKNGQSIEAATSNLQYHTKEEIIKALNDPKYAIRGKKASKTARTGEKVLDAQIEYSGSFSETRTIQRTSTVFANIAHSISDLREVTNDEAIQTITCSPKFSKAKAFIIEHMGENWQPQICELLDNNRNIYGTAIGKLQVSTVVLDIVLAYIAGAAKITCKALNEHLRLTLPLPCSEHAQHGSSVQHTKRILTLLVKSEILIPHYAGRSTHYTAVRLNAILLDQLSSNNLKRADNTGARGLEAKEEENTKRPARSTSPLPVSTGSERESQEDKEQDSEISYDIKEYVGCESPSPILRSLRRRKVEYSQNSESLLKIIS